jgi:hypothetical protein
LVSSIRTPLHKNTFLNYQEIGALVAIDCD